MSISFEAKDHPKRPWFAAPADDWIHALPVGDGRLGLAIVGLAIEGGVCRITAPVPLVLVLEGDGRATQAADAGSPTERGQRYRFVPTNDRREGAHGAGAQA